MNETAQPAVAGPVEPTVRPASEALRRAYYYTELGGWRGPEVDEDERWSAVAEVAAQQIAAAEREVAIAHMALTAIRSHWREFGPECGFDETLEEACKVLEA